MATMNLSLPAQMKQWVEAQTKDGRYSNSSDNVRDLIRRDKERAEAEQFARLKAELHRAFAAPDSDFVPLDADTVIGRARRN